MRDIFSWASAVSGFCLFSYGAYLIWDPLGFAFAGVFLMLISFRISVLSIPVPDWMKDRKPTKTSDDEDELGANQNFR